MHIFDRAYGVFDSPHQRGPDSSNDRCIFLPIPQGDYDKAVEYCGRCYDLCCKLDDNEALHSARVQYGIAKGHQFMTNFSTYVNEPSDNSLQKLVTWKDVRVAPHSEDSEYNGGTDSDSSDDSTTPETQGEEGANIGKTEHDETTISDNEL